MKLRKPCQHGRYDLHYTADGWPDNECPGGVFLPDDTLVIEKVDVDDPECGDCDHLPRREWPSWAIRAMYNVRGHNHSMPKALLDALSVREAEPEVEKNQLGMW